MLTKLCHYCQEYKPATKNMGAMGFDVCRACKPAYDKVLEGATRLEYVRGGYNWKLASGSVIWRKAE